MAFGDFFNFTHNQFTNLYNDTNIPTEDHKVKGFFYVLMVKPDLNIHRFGIHTDNIDASLLERGDYDQSIYELKTFKGLINEYILQNLTHSDEHGNSSTSYFSSIIASKVESISYPDVGSNSEETLTTLDKASFKLPINETGVSGMSFQMRLRENDGGDCLRMLSTWHKYIQGVTKGYLNPSNEYLTKNIIDYKASIYILHTKPDGKTITMWSKYTGIYPVNVPLSAFSEDITSVTDVAIEAEFSYDKFEWMNEDLLREINLLTSGIPLKHNFNYNRYPTTNTLNQLYYNQRAPLIRKLDGSPYYYMDMNGLTEKVRSNISVNQTGAAAFGATNNNEYDVFFPVPITQEMVLKNTGINMTSGLFENVKRTRNRL